MCITGKGSGMLHVAENWVVVLWVVTPSSDAVGHQRFGGP